MAEHDAGPLKYFQELLDEAEENGHVKLTTEDLYTVMMAITAEMGTNLVKSFEVEVMGGLRADRDEALYEFNRRTEAGENDNADD